MKVLNRRFGYFTDSHFTLKNNVRQDDFFTALLGKLDNSLFHFVKTNCEFVLFGGDFFDKHREFSWDLMYRVREVICKYDIPLYYIAGNHDESGYNVESIARSNLGFLDNISDGKLVFLKEPLLLDWIHIYPHHAGTDLKESVDKVKKSDVPTVLVSHSLLSNNLDIGNIHINTIKNKNINLVLSGDLHDGYELQQNNSDIYCYNPGSLFRKSVVDMERKPTVATIQFDKLLNVYYPVLDKYCPPYNSDPSIFKLSERVNSPVVVDKSDEADYIAKFREFKRESKNIFEVLEKIGAESGISEDVLKLINSFKTIVTDD